MSARKENIVPYIVYIGDGHTDLCPIQLADLVYAKGFLKTHCEEKLFRFLPFQTFKDIKLGMERLLQRRVFADFKSTENLQTSLGSPLH